MFDPETLRLLKRTRDIIADEAHWCQHVSALDMYGYPTSSLADDAGQFCLMGAMRKALGYVVSPLELAPVYQAVRAVLVSDDDDADTFRLSEFNDTHTHAEVLSALDAAISEYEGE